MVEQRRVALVSGANRGIGLEVARQLAERGLTVVLGSRDEKRGEKAAAKLEGDVRPHQLDVADQASVDRLAASIEDELGRLDVLVNNAGILPKGHSVAEVELEQVREALETNLFGAWRLAQSAIPLMRRNGYGRIVNISSGMGQLSDMGAGSPAYRVSKTAINALTRMLAAELRGQNILVNSVCPGWVETDMGGRGAPRSVEQGADTAVWLATVPDDGPTGGFFRDRKPIPW